MLRLLVVSAVLVGCAHPREATCLTLSLGLAECSREHEDDRLAASAARRDARADRATYGDEDRARRDRAAPACASGDAAACLEQAIYDDRHHGDPLAIDRAYRVACAGGRAFGCLRAGDYANAVDRPGGPDRAYAKQAYLRGCERGERQACRLAAQLMPDRAVELDEAGCELRDYDACYRAGLAHRDAAGTPLDRTRGAQRLALACEHRVDAACRELAYFGSSGQSSNGL